MSMVQIQILGLIACRVFSFMSVAPILSERNFPNLCKLILGGGLILSAFSLAAAFEEEVALAVFILMAVKETIFGLAMGKEFPFEDTTVLLPEQADTYLRHFFGDYMKFPPVEQRVEKHLRYYLNMEKRETWDEIKRKL